MLSKIDIKKKKDLECICFYMNFKCKISLK